MQIYKSLYKDAGYLMFGNLCVALGRVVLISFAAVHPSVAATADVVGTTVSASEYSLYH
jgi:hypothetical protein